MTKITLVLLIASGYVLGNLVWEVIGLVVEWSGRLAGWLIAVAAKKALQARQEQALTPVNQRPPIVQQSGQEASDLEPPIQRNNL